MAGTSVQPGDITGHDDKYRNVPLLTFLLDSLRDRGSHRRLHAFSADYDRGGFRNVLLHDDEDLAPDNELGGPRLEKETTVAFVGMVMVCSPPL